MITIQEPVNLPDTYPLTRIGNLSEIVFFDIETTGFSGEWSNLYLIGCTYYKNNSWHLIQWFADSFESETEVLCSFFEFLSHYKILIHFNGDGFDIPYLKKRCLALNLPFDFNHIISIDIYKKIRPYKKLLGLDSLKQKSIERFLGIKRTDQYSGGELIQVYKDYLITKEQELYDMLILHNEEDLKGMPLILPILNYSDFLEHDFEFSSQNIIKKRLPDGTSCPVLQLVCENQFHIPVSFSFQNSLVSVNAEKHLIMIDICLYEGTLKYFHPNYKDYYYLIYEDYAVHKSIAEFVDKKSRKKATAKTCYTKHDGRYLPQFTPIQEPYLQNSYGDKITYLPFNEDYFKNTSHLQSYLNHLFQHIYKS